MQLKISAKNILEGVIVGLIVNVIWYGFSIIPYEKIISESSPKQEIKTNLPHQENAKSSATPITSTQPKEPILNGIFPFYKEIAVKYSTIIEEDFEQGGWGILRHFVVYFFSFFIILLLIALALVISDWEIHSYFIPILFTLWCIVVILDIFLLGHAIEVALVVPTSLIFFSTGILLFVWIIYFLGTGALIYANVEVTNKLSDYLDNNEGSIALLAFIAILVSVTWATYLYTSTYPALSVYLFMV